jgi:hypothetical protein
VDIVKFSGEGRLEEDWRNLGVSRKPDGASIELLAVYAKKVKQFSS